MDRWAWGSDSKGDDGLTMRKQVRQQGRKPAKRKSPSLPHRTKHQLDLKYICCWVRKQKKINAFMTNTKKENLIVLFCAYSFPVSRKAQIASETIYISLHNLTITIWQRSSRPSLLHLFAYKMTKMYKITVWTRSFLPSS